MSDQQQQEFDDFFAGSGGGEYAPSLKFTHDSGPGGRTQVGAGVVGTILSMAMQDQTKQGTDEKIPDGKGGFKRQTKIILQTELRNWDKVAKVPTDDEGNPLAATEDDGKRAIYSKGWMIGAIGDAVEKTTGTRGAPKIGGRLGVKITELVPTDKGNPYPKYEAMYEAPAAPGIDEAFAGSPSQAPAPQAPAPQAPAPQAPAPQAPAADQPPF